MSCPAEGATEVDTPPAPPVNSFMLLSYGYKTMTNITGNYNNHSSQTGTYSTKSLVKALQLAKQLHHNIILLDISIVTAGFFQFIGITVKILSQKHQNNH